MGVKLSHMKFPSRLTYVPGCENITARYTLYPCCTSETAFPGPRRQHQGWQKVLIGSVQCGYPLRLDNELRRGEKGRCRLLTSCTAFWPNRNPRPLSHCSCIISCRPLHVRVYRLYVVPRHHLKVICIESVGSHVRVILHLFLQQAIPDTADSMESMFRPTDFRPATVERAQGWTSPIGSMKGKQTKPMASGQRMRRSSTDSGAKTP